MEDKHKAILINHYYKHSKCKKIPFMTPAKIYDVWQDTNRLGNYWFRNDNNKLRSYGKSRFLPLDEHRCNIINDILE